MINMVATWLLSAIFALGLVAIVPAIAVAQAASIEELATGQADTPAEHKAVASYYRGKAEQARTEAAIHRRMAEAFGIGKYTEKKTMRTHCEGLVASFETQAKQYDALAADHDSMSK